MEGQVGAIMMSACPPLTGTAAEKAEITTTQDPLITAEEESSSRATGVEEESSMAPEGEPHIQVGVQEGKISLDLHKVCLERHLQIHLNLGQVQVQVHNHSWPSSSLLHHSLSWASWVPGHTHLAHHRPFLLLPESSIYKQCCLFRLVFLL